MKLIERFRRVSPDMIEYTGTVEDPAKHHGAVPALQAQGLLTSGPGYRVYEYSCSGNTVVSGGLSGERAFERRVAEAGCEGRACSGSRASRRSGPAPEDGTVFFNVNEGE